MSFMAKYRGVCHDPDCGLPFDEGARVMYDQYGDLVHYRCPDPITGLYGPDDVAMSTAPCPKCFCYHVGECA